MSKTFTGKDGELRIYEYGISSSSDAYYLKILFCDMNLTGPIANPHPEETLILDRQTFNNNSHYVEGSDETQMTPKALTFSCRIDDQTYTQALHDWLSGTTDITNNVAGVSTIYSWSGKTGYAGGGTSLPIFRDGDKSSYRLEVMYEGSSVSQGWRWEEVYFPPGEQNITEAPESVILGVNGQVYGDVTRIAQFTARGIVGGSTYLNFV